MQLTLELTPQTEAWLTNQAQQRGLSLADLVRIVTEEQASVADRHRIYKTPQEHIAAMDAIAEQNANAPILPDSAFDRESIYNHRL